jgi:putative ABC transport system permease protein
MMTSRSTYRDALLGDLREEYARRALGDRAAADRWVWKHSLSIALRFLPSWLAPRRHRAQRGDRPMSVLAHDVRHGLRVMRRSPGFTAIVLLTLALGIGANGAVFSVVRGVLLKPLAYADPDRVVSLYATNAARGWSRAGVSRQDADDWALESRVFAALGVYAEYEANLVIGSDPQRIKASYTTASVFKVLGVQAGLGRGFAQDDDDPKRSRVAVLSHALWSRALGSDSGAIGRVVTVNGIPLTIVGVMPPGFEFPDAATAVWMPFPDPPDATGPRIARWANAVARLRPGITVEDAQAALSVIAARLATEYPASNQDIGVRVEPRLSAITADVRIFLFVAWAMAALVLSMVAINTANLTLARAMARENDVAIRAALGAGKTALARQFLVESLLYAFGGGALGIGLAVAVMPLLRHLAVVGIPRAQALVLDPVGIAYTVGVALVVGVAFGVMPALGAASTAPASALRGAGRGITNDRERVRSGLIVAQVAIALVVMVGAGLLFRSFERVSRVEPGFVLRDRVAFRIAPDWGAMRERDRAETFYEQFLTRLTAIPGVNAAAAVNRLPLTGAWWTTTYSVDGEPVPPGKEPSASYRVVMPGYFATMGIPLIRGRTLSAADGVTAERVVLVSRSLADRVWPGRDPLGKRLSFNPRNPNEPRYTVVGVVGDVHTTALANLPEPLVYVSLAQARFGHFGDWGMDLVVRTTIPQGTVLAAVRRQLAAVAPSVPLYEARPLTALVDADLAQQRLLLLLIGGFALIAVLLAGVGLYGVVAYAVAQRRREFGLRMALGAESATVWRSVVGRGLVLTVVGVVLGVAVASAATGVLARLLYGISPLDAVSFVAAAGLLLLIAVAAAWIPAFRACRVSPAETLRST